MIRKIDMTVTEFEHEGMACGPCGESGVIGETEYEEDGERRFLTGIWVDLVGDAIEIRNTKVSIRSLYTEEDVDPEEFDRVRAEADVPVGAGNMEAFRQLAEELCSRICEDAECEYEEVTCTLFTKDLPDGEDICVINTGYDEYGEFDDEDEDEE